MGASSAVEWEDEGRELSHVELMQDPAYCEYMSMPKAFVRGSDARRLAFVYRQLKDKAEPAFLQTAGWAAAEVALARVDMTPSARLSALASAERAWERALAIQTMREQTGRTAQRAQMHRIALDLAIMPLLRGVVAGDVTEAACRKAFANCLAVAESNMAYLQAARARGDHAAAAAHSGLAYECNALLTHNRKFSSTRFIIPATARCDSGYYYRQETHDLLVIRQKYGRIISAVPVEIKAKASLRDRSRYQALLVRGKMHLSVRGKALPDYTLHAISTAHDGSATAEELSIADTTTERLNNMIRDYCAGQVLGEAASQGSVIVFHDSARLRACHPGLSVLAPAA